ncbi:MAG: hypothetical protein RL071_3035 [Pseudomonadota bacterium]
MSAPSAPVAPRQPLRDAAVLVVDDDPLLRRNLSRALLRAGAAVTEAASFTAALEALRDATFDLVLLDLGLPDGDGLGLLPLLRAVPSSALTPVLVLTGRADDDSQVEALESGADDFLSKGVQVPVLLARAANLVARRRAELQASRLTAELERYVSQPARSRLLGNRKPERLHATILFSDLRGFTATSLAEDLDTLFEAMNTVLARQAELVRHWGGYVDKFSGDGMLAVFPDAQGALQAVCAAADIVRWARDDEAVQIWHPLPVGLGIHVGPVLRGDLGSEDRREFTVLGSTVNIAARLCGVAGPLECYLSGAALAELPPGAAERAGLVVGPLLPLPLKGLSSPLPACTVRPGPGSDPGGAPAAAPISGPAGPARPRPAG